MKYSRRSWRMGGVTLLALFCTIAPTAIAQQPEDSNETSPQEELQEFLSETGKELDSAAQEAEERVSSAIAETEQQANWGWLGLLGLLGLLGFVGKGR